MEMGVWLVGWLNLHSKKKKKRVGFGSLNQKKKKGYIAKKKQVVVKQKKIGSKPGEAGERKWEECLFHSFRTAQHSTA